MAFLPVSITSLSSLSPLGNAPEDVWANYLRDQSWVKPVLIGDKTVQAASLPENLKAEVSALRDYDLKYRNLDKSVLYAILASRAAVAAAGWNQGDVFGINIGSSRGATELFEQYYQYFLETGRSNVTASPSTTLGNISSWVAHDLKSSGPDISHSITCSTALHSLLNGVAWLRAGMAEKFLIGGSEAPLTPFTVAQMQAMKIYSKDVSNYPCRALDDGSKANTMVLGEGAVAACLEPGRKENAMAYIEGIGYATEMLHHGASLSADAECLRKSMRMALGDYDPAEVDAIVMHAPGTIKGDAAELAAVQGIFGEAVPLLTTNKWKIGHTFGASGLLSVEMAILMMQKNIFVPVPYLKGQNNQERNLKKILVNAVGFGGNAVSVLLSR